MNTLRVFFLFSPSLWRALWRAPWMALWVMLWAPLSATSSAEPQMPVTPAEAVANPARSEADRTLDPQRKPAEVLTFFGISPGMKVLDVFAGGGYYAEIMSYLVGPDGSVTLYNNNPWDNFVRKAVDERLAGNRLPNVQRVTRVPSELADMEPGYDAAIFVLGMHDIYYEDLGNDWPAINVKTFLDNIHGLLKPGAVFGVIDHIGATGSDPAEVGKSLHRIDPAVIIRDIEAAGFELEDSSDLLRNPDDNLTELVFKPELRWRSDRTVLRFRKPAT